MLVSELIEHLKKLPQNMHVLSSQGCTCSMDGPIIEIERTLMRWIDSDADIPSDVEVVVLKA